MPTLRDKGKPSIFLLEPIEREKENAKQYTKNEEALRAYGSLVDAIYPVVTTRCLQQDTLDKLEIAFRSSHKTVWDTASNYFVILCHYFDEALEQFRKLSIDSKASIRLRAVQSQFRYTVPEPLLTEIIRQGLTDSSEQVRTFAIQRCGQLKRRDFIPQLEELATGEKSKRVCDALKFALDQMELANNA